MGIIALQTTAPGVRATRSIPARRAHRAAVLIFSVAAGSSAAQAVDIRNRDRVEQEVTVNHSDGRSETIKIPAGRTAPNVCSDCVVLGATTSVEVKGDATVKIERGEVSIDGKR